ncbi:MAG TPA: xanthine dehydrogenase small subunit [Rhizomicrobium sp.]|nr:xanthine dehydrogenase small subunit [Rhizomicrobium sp.]
MRDTVRFRLDGALHAVKNPDPTQTVLRHLRTALARTGTKEGCAEGDCGACTVVLEENGTYRAVNACILFLPMLDGKTLYTVESLSVPGGPLHPVQQAMVEANASQCGFCTPGFVMSLFAHYLNKGACDPATIRDVLAGNLCRCTGYGPILEAAGKMNDVPRVEPAAAAADIASDATLAVVHDGRRFFAPHTRAELASLLREHPEAVLLAGATDVGLWVTKQYRDLPTIISVASVKELRAIRETPDTIEIGAAVTYSEGFDALARVHPDLGELLRRLGSVQVRNAGTIGGNIANGSPIGDMPPPLIALGATLVLGSVAGTRTLPLEDYFVAYGRQDRRAGEFVEKVIIPKLKPGEDFRVYKLSKRFDQDISAVCGAFLFRRDGGAVREVRIAYGGMAETPKRAAAAEAALAGKPFSEANIRAAMTALERDFTPLSDMRGSARYRLDAAKNLLLKAYLEVSGAGAMRVLEVADG